MYGANYFFAGYDGCDSNVKLPEHLRETELS